MNKALLQRRYQKRYLAKLKSLDCWCGNKAVKFSRGSPACQRCLDIEARLNQLEVKNNG